MPGDEPFVIGKMGIHSGGFLESGSNEGEKQGIELDSPLVRKIMFFEFGNVRLITESNVWDAAPTFSRHIRNYLTLYIEIFHTANLVKIK